MKKTVLLAVFYLCLYFAFSQEKLPDFGKPDRRELELKECEFDKNANAMILLDHQEKEIIAEYGLKIKTGRRIKIKIFNEKGFASANIRIPYISRIKGTRITYISAYIHYLDPAGKIVTEKVSKKQIFRDREDDKVKNIRFTFPNVKAGCVIEYKYEKTERNSLHLEPWYFQDVLPTLHSHLTLIIPTLIGMDSRIVGAEGVEAKSAVIRGKSLVSSFEKTFSLRNIPAFKAEPMMSSVADNLQRIEFAIQPSALGFFGISFLKNKWEMYAKALNMSRYFGKQYDIDIPGAENLLDSARKIDDREKKIDFVFQRVKQQVKWDGQQTFYPGDITDAWKERSGNSAEINLIILNLLRKSGIGCSPILISTRDNGKTDEDFHTLSQFNGLDVLVMDSTTNYVLDGTRKYQSYRTPPENILNRSAFNMDTSSISWITISDNRPLLKSTVNVFAMVSDEGSVNGSVFATFYDHSKVQRLMDKNKTEEEEKEEEKEFLQKDFTGLRIDSLVQENADNELEPLIEKYSFTYQPSVSGEFIFIDPFFVSNFRKNPFTDSVRYSSIDFNSRQYLRTSVSIELPDSYQVDHLPRNVRLRMQDSSILFERRIYHEGNRLLFTNTMEILYPLFERDEYDGIRNFFDRLYGMVTEQIILKRKQK